jgi:hypothetical protein
MEDMDMNHEAMAKAARRFLEALATPLPPSPAALANAEQMAENAVGKSFRFQVRKATRKQSGIIATKTIVACTFAQWRERDYTRIAQFAVTFTDGTTTLLEQLPR